MNRQVSTAILWILVTLWGGTCFAGDLSREVERLRATVEALTKRIEVQDQKIAALEDALKTLAGSSSRGLPMLESGLKQAPVPLEGWKSPASWERIKPGMTQSQVRQILGSPISTKAEQSGEFWYYEGHVPGSGDVSGYITFFFYVKQSSNTPRVVGVDKPVFLGR